MLGEGPNTWRVSHCFPGFLGDWRAVGMVSGLAARDYEERLRELGHTTLEAVLRIPNPDPDPPDPCVFGPPGSGSGSISQWYGSGSFYHQVKFVRKTLIPTVL